MVNEFENMGAENLVALSENSQTGNFIQRNIAQASGCAPRPANPVMLKFDATVDAGSERVRNDFIAGTVPSLSGLAGSGQSGVHSRARVRRAVSDADVQAEGAR